MTSIFITEGGATAADSLRLTGSNGAGYINLSNQSSTPIFIYVG